MRKIFFFILLIPFYFFGDFTIKDRLQKANPGDYMVTEQGSVYSLFLIRSVAFPFITLEEISIDKSKVDLKKLSWKTWVENKAPGAISWTGYLLDLEKNDMLKGYSYLDSQWILFEQSEGLLASFLSLPFRPTRDHERKKIGPAPMPGEIDRRKFWKPQLVRYGKTAKRPEYQVLRSKWPADKTQLAGCIIELYLDIAEPSFPFPYWVEVQHPHFTFKVRTVDSGTGMQSPARLLK